MSAKRPEATPRKGAAAPQPRELTRDGARRLTVKGESRRRDILQAAADLFDDVGYHNASILMIADRVGTTKANVYHYFKAKHDILYAIHDDWIDQLIDLFGRNVAGKRTVEDAIRQIFYDLLFVIHAHRSQVRVYFEYLHELPDEMQARAVIKRDHYESLVRSVIRQGEEEGVLRPVHSRVATFGLFGMCNWTYQWYRSEGALGHEEVAEMLCEIFMTGMLTRVQDAGPA